MSRNHSKEKIMVAQQTRGNAAAAEPSDRPQVSNPEPLHDVVEYMREYARTQPEMAALWCIGFGVVLGWKLRAW